MSEYDGDSPTEFYLSVVKTKGKKELVITWKLNGHDNFVLHSTNFSWVKFFVVVQILMYKFPYSRVLFFQNHEMHENSYPQKYTVSSGRTQPKQFKKELPSH